MTTLRPYPAYKSSGIDWLGDIPRHWSYLPLKVATKINRKVLPEFTDPDYERPAIGTCSHHQVRP